MHTRTRLVGLFAVAITSVAAFQAQLVETFDGGSNEAGWDWVGTASVLASVGGNPGGFLYNPASLEFAPQCATTERASNTAFLGDLREIRVTDIRFDLRAFVAGGFFDMNGNPLSLQKQVTVMLKGRRTGVLIPTTQLTPVIEAGWVTYDVPIPTAATTMPAGWITINEGLGTVPKRGEDRDAVWNDTVEDVREIWIGWGDPTKLHEGPLVWDVGVDNIELVCQ